MSWVLALFVATVIAPKEQRASDPAKTPTNQTRSQPTEKIKSARRRQTNRRSRHRLDRSRRRNPTTKADWPRIGSRLRVRLFEIQVHQNVPQSDCSRCTCELRPKWKKPRARF